MNFIKKNKLLTIFLILIIISIILVAILLMQLIGGNKKGEYGDRLNGIEKVEITSDIKNQLEKEIANEDLVTKVKYDLKGRLINIILNVKDEKEIDSIKEMGNKILSYFDEEQLSYYDIQILVNSDNEESEKYPIIGYKHKTRDTINWD